MRRFVLPFALLSFSLLSACGNVDKGKPFGYQNKTSAAKTSQSAALTPVDYCKNFTVVQGSNPAYSTIFAGSTVCKLKGSATKVRVNVSANFPANTRFCLVPMTEFAYRESCFTVNGLVDVDLDPQSLGYTSISLVAETDVNAYKAFLNLQTLASPPRGVAFMTL